MKNSLLILTIATACLTAGANGSFADLFGNLTDSIIEKLDNVTLSALQSASNFSNNVNNVTQALIAQAEKHAAEAGRVIDQVLDKTVLNFVKNLDSFRINLSIQLNSLRNKIKKDILNDAENILNDLHENAEELQKQISELREKWRKDIQNEEQKILQDWNIWASTLLGHVAEDTKGAEVALQKAENLVNEFVNRFSNDLNRAANEVESELNDFENNINSLIQKYQPAINNLVQAVEDCLTSGNGLIASYSCSRNVQRRLNTLKEALSDFENLAEEGLNLLTSRFKKRSSVVQILAEFRIERHGISVKIEAIIKEYNSSDNADSSESSDSSDSSDSSNSSDSSDSSASSDSSDSSDSSESSDSSDSSNSSEESGVTTP